MFGMSGSYLKEQRQSLLRNDWRGMCSQVAPFTGLPFLYRMLFGVLFHDGKLQGLL
jgi:hypothetical protein